MTGPSQVTYVRSDGSKSSPSSVSQTHSGPGGGAYQTEVINGVAYTTWVPAGTKIYSGSKGGKYGVPAGARKIVDTTTSTSMVGDKVATVKETPTPQAAQEARAKEIAKASSQGQKLTTQQQAELQRNLEAQAPKTVIVKMPLNELDKQRAELQAAGVYDNYLDYLQGNYEPGGQPMGEEQSATPSFTVQRQPSPQETQPIIQEPKFNSPFPESQNARATGEIHAVAPEIEPSNALKQEVAQNTLTTMADSNPVLLPVVFGFGIAKGSVTGLKSTIDYAKDKYSQVANTPDFKAKAWEVLETPGEIAGGIIEGIGEIEASVVQSAEQGSLGPIAYEAGSLYGQAKQAEFVGNLAKGEAAYIQKAKFYDITEGAAKGPIENPSFARPFDELGIRDANPPAKPNKDFLRIPTEQTEMGKTFEKASSQSIDANAGELLPGTYLEASQPKSIAEKSYYEQPGNKPTQMQTRLSMKQETPKLPIETAQEVLERQSAKGTTQMTLAEKPAKRDYFNSPEWKEKQALADAEKNSKALAVADPFSAAAVTIGELWVEGNDIIKGKYKAYKEFMANADEGRKLARGEKPLMEGRMRPVPFIIANQEAPQVQSPTRINMPSGNEKAKTNPSTGIGIRSEITTEPWHSTGGKPKADTKPTQASATSQAQTIQTATQTQQSTATRQVFQQSTARKLENAQPWPEQKHKQKDKPAAARSGFKAQVRSRGVFGSSGVFDTATQAQRAAETIVKNTASAAFKITDLEGNTQKVRPGKGFRPSKRESGVVIQEREQRIKTAGEKREITFAPKPSKGASGKKKKLFGGKPWAF